ncbi:alpha/beta fold hydrolase [Profundibacterium mesophilum]|uniref:Pyruvate dehydrogenase E2 component n=1 Tax=Profundibacterium mesophilum KAUST100406-0324 TaxID=1037889 RepID=A0A921NVS4_9RHOB|nr:alpha/beta fold hydrolase [Profundibacterium mesophilum]KAF0676226.1 pyruvate dehydrogenase E2 component [Profundibacterium mesophilum KAUST100406-0324]
MTDFLLVHGSCHGAWCWRDVIPELVALGHRARAIDLPSHGADPTDPAEATLESYAQAILDALEGPTVLVGHSMGGYPITQAAENDPSHISRLVYLCAYVPRGDESLADMRRSAARQPLAPAIRIAPDRITMGFDPDMVGALFYHDCPEGTLDYARAHLCPQPMRPQATPLRRTGRGAGIARSYIRCDDDRAIPPEFQAEMTRDWPPEDVHALPVSHSPFFASPKRLAALLSEIAS